MKGSIQITLKKEKSTSKPPSPSTTSSMHLILTEDSRKIIDLYSTEQGSANCLQAKSSPSFAFANKVLVEHGHAPLSHCLGLLSRPKSRSKQL